MGKQRNTARMTRHNASKWGLVEMLPHICQLGDVLEVPIMATIDNDGNEIPCIGVTGRMEYKGRGGAKQTRKWELTLDPPIKGAGWTCTFESKGPEDIGKNHFKGFELVGPNVRTWSKNVNVVRGGVVRGTVNQLKIEYLGNRAIENLPPSS